MLQNIGIALQCFILVLFFLLWSYSFPSLFFCPQLLVPGSSASPPGANGGGSTASSGVSTGAASPSGSLNNSSCCENGRPIMTDPVSGQTVCSCQYDSARLALSSYPRLSTGAGVYGTPYPSTDQNPYPSIDSTAFYSPLVSFF